MTSRFRVADIVAHPTLDTRVIAGAGGVDRTVLWAHSCEKPDPARWLGPHELLMTIGLCIPRGSRAQRDLIASLDEAGVAGMTVADDDLSPRLTAAMLAEADARSFPVLATGSNTPFAAIGRTVAAANAERQTMQVLLLAKLYQIAGQREDSRRSSSSLDDLFGTKLTVVDTATGCVVVGSGVVAPRIGRSYHLRTHRPTHLIVESPAGLDAFSLVHLTQVLAVDANVVLQKAIQSAQERAAVLESALRGRTQGQAEVARLWSDDGTAYRVVATECDVDFRVPLAISLAGMSAFATEKDGRVVIATPVHDLDQLRGVLANLGLIAASSGEQHDVRDLPGALAEAVSELPAAIAAGTPWQEFHGQRVSLLARSHTESSEIVRSVLGPLVTDDPHIVPLRETLFAFMDNDMRWKVTADVLGLHRQSVAYRLNQVEALTGRSVRRTKDLSELWLARMAWDHHVKSRTT